VEPGEEIPYDDITGTPGGVNYRSKVYPTDSEGNYWPPIQSTSVTMNSWFSEINVSYRHYIETEAGETRNNIFKPSREGKHLREGEIELYATSIPPGMTLTQYMAGGGIRPPLVAVLVIEISPNAAPGQYSFEIGLELNGWDYGTVPCTIEVVWE
jgi:hypothetical protein